ncbi:BTAD domain-containing putative transcriptional regulator [Sphaerisporangium sp. TRM90804]|uniref:AfsR/SARP family transcriptional regulator n=1 Tax=Sphaerisporangium sp. TRM90804 TaxID=3031113 RepID=UPI00244C21C7|nr:BTAD domain-containing putative transcriptional regulator [Sphaerisporangium sp. TRM90804]MDH2427203.1 BTAD domain-containing putative transcriptional regulator [Sphaerisporangium sp. TRM90804]
MEFYVLGPLRVMDGAGDVTPQTPKLRGLLGLLLMRHNQVVQVGELIDELWGERPPASAASTLQTYVYKLRKTLLGGYGEDGKGLLRTRPQGYQMVVPPQTLDLCRFQELSDEGRARLAAGDAEAAADALDAAVSLWRGRPLAGMGTRKPLKAHVARLEESRLSALEWRVEAKLRLGRHGELVDELERLLAVNPLHEGLAAKLMKVLHLSGRPAEAVAVYRRLRQAFAEDLGLEPSPVLQRLYRDLTTGAGTPGRRPAPAAVPAPVSPDVAARGATASTRLPADPPGLVGRERVAGAVERLLLERPGGGGATPIVSLAGVPGVGKTALAVHLAHRLRPRFRGGVHFVALGGSGASPAEPVAVLDELLGTLGAPRGHRRAEEASAAFRTWITGRNALIVVDDPRSAAQARLFLPGCSESAVIVTSRSGMYGLAGAHVVELDTLSADDGVGLLTTMLGRRAEEAPDEVRRIARLCDDLPLALSGAAARLLASPELSLRDYADRLTGPARRLAELSHGDLDMRRGYDAGYLRLGEAEREALCRLGTARLTGFTAHRVSHLLGWGVAAAESAIVRLVEHRFVRVSGRDPSGELHYAFAPLSRAYVWERVSAGTRAAVGLQGS